MAAAMSKKTGKTFELKDREGKHAATKYFEDSTIAVEVGKMGAECYFSLRHTDWQDWRKKAKVKM